MLYLQNFWVLRAKRNGGELLELERQTPLKRVIAHLCQNENPHSSLERERHTE